MNTITVTGIDEHGLLISENIVINGVSINKYRSIGGPHDFIEEAFKEARERRARQIHKARRKLHR